MPGKFCEVVIDDGDCSFQCGDEYILDAALEHGIQLPHNCRGGACGTCKAEIVEGEVEHGWIMSFAITDEEKADGRCLICVAKPRTSRIRLRLLRPLVADHGSAARPAEYLTVVQSTRAVSPSVREITLRLPAEHGFRFVPGMYVDVSVDAAGTTRPYSIVTVPDAEGAPPDGQLTLLVARHDGGKCSTKLHEDIQVGDPLRICGPYGTFTTPKGASDRLLLIAGGTGLAPLLSIAGNLLGDGYVDPIELHFSVRTADDVFCLESLRALADRFENFSFRLFLTREQHQGAMPGAIIGRVETHLRARTDLASVGYAFIAGAPGFVEICADAMRSAGLGTDSIICESYSFRGKN